LEAVRYITMVPACQARFLTDPDQQLEMLETFLRRQPHEDTVIEFTDAPVDDLVLAIIAGLNWLSRCALLAGVGKSRFSGTLRHFRRIATVAQQWWALDGADARYVELLEAGVRPPVMLHLV
jgi:hypothetical protein